METKEITKIAKEFGVKLPSTFSACQKEIDRLFDKRESMTYTELIAYCLINIKQIALHLKKYGISSAEYTTTLMKRWETRLNKILEMDPLKDK